jgi:ABC-type transport system involved in Fe-S cluster assembly fused permease/ATPase subunit
MYGGVNDSEIMEMKNNPEKAYQFKKTLIDVCKKASLFDFLIKLPEYFQTKVGERGLRLSGGEK